MEVPLQIRKRVYIFLDTYARFANQKILEVCRFGRASCVLFLQWHLEKVASNKEFVLPGENDVI